jgi:hypothetical protein
MGGQVELFSFSHVNDANAACIFASHSGIAWCKHHHRPAIAQRRAESGAVPELPFSLRVVGLEAPSPENSKPQV